MQGESALLQSSSGACIADKKGRWKWGTWKAGRREADGQPSQRGLGASMLEGRTSVESRLPD